MRGVRRLAAAVLAVISLGAPVEAQPAPLEVRTGHGLHSATFQTPFGTITLTLPDDLAAGEVVSGTVLADPAGTSDADRRKNAEELERFDVVPERGRFVVPPGSPSRPAGRSAHVAGWTFRWTVPKKGAGRVVIANEVGRLLARAEIPVLPETSARPTPAPDAPAPKPGDFALPAKGPSGGALEIRGPFDGDFATTEVRIGREAALLLAESPRKAVFETPARPITKTKLVVKEQKVESSGAFRVEKPAPAPRVTAAPVPRATAAKPAAPPS